MSNIEVKALPNTPAPAPKAEKGVLDFAEIHDADMDRFDIWLAKVWKDDMRPVNLSAFTSDKGPRFTAVAIKEPAPRDWEFARFYGSSDEIGKQLQEFWDKKFLAVSHCAFGYNDTVGLGVLWLKDPTRNNRSIWGGVDKTIQAKIKNATGHRVLTRSIHTLAKETRHVVVMTNDDGQAWQETYDVTLDQLEAWVEKHKADGYRLDHVHTYGSGASTRFGGIMVKEAQSADWDVTWKLTPADYADRIEERRREGFRPLLAMQHEGSGGARHYSVIWIRFRSEPMKATP